MKLLEDLTGPARAQTLSLTLSRTQTIQNFNPNFKHPFA